MLTAKQLPRRFRAGIPVVIRAARRRSAARPREAGRLANGSGRAICVIIENSSLLSPHIKTPDFAGKPEFLSLFLNVSNGSANGRSALALDGALRKRAPSDRPRPWPDPNPRALALFAGQVFRPNALA